MHATQMTSFALLLLALFSTACCSKPVHPTALDADQFTLYSIDGNHYPGSPTKIPDHIEIFHGYPVLGKIELNDKTDRQTLLQALAQGIDDSDGTVAGCFIPRHGIRAVKGIQTLDYVICFECMQVVIHDNGVITQELTTDGPAATFNGYLTRAKVPLAPR